MSTKTQNKSSECDEDNIEVTQLLEGRHGLFLLDASPSSKVGGLEPTYNADLIAVHGINGDCLKTWTHPYGSCWLRDFLPTKLPGLRTFTYGYDSKVAFTRSFGSLSDFAR
jgi:hypothetical protein